MCTELLLDCYNDGVDFVAYEIIGIHYERFIRIRYGIANVVPDYNELPVREPLPIRSLYIYFFFFDINNSYDAFMDGDERLEEDTTDQGVLFYANPYFRKVG